MDNQKQLLKREVSLITCQAEYLYVLNSSPIFIRISGSIKVVSMFFSV